MNTTSPKDVTGWVPDAANPPVTRVGEARVAAFIAAHKLEDWVELAVRLARESFPAATAIKVSMYGGPDDEEYGERLHLEVATGVNGDETLRQRADFVARWIDSTPPWVTDLMGIYTELS
jgi:hypothetical protein